MKLSPSFIGALRTFSYFIASGTHYRLKGVPYLELFGEEPSAIEQAFAIYCNVIEMDDDGVVINAKYAEQRAVDFIRAYCEEDFEVQPPLADWELELHSPPSANDLKS